MTKNILLASIILTSSVPTIIQTPKGSNVYAYTYDEMSESSINQYNYIADTYFSSDIRLSNSSKKYNNHSYAFYLQRVMNTFWIEDIALYLNDDNTYNGLYTNHNTHDYGYKFLNYSNNYHRTYCKCDLSQLEMHDYRKNLSMQIQFCKCGEENPNYLGGGIILKEETDTEEN